MSPPMIVPSGFLGLRTDIRANAHFVSDSEVIYPAGGVLVLHDFDERTQRFINLSPNQKTIKSIAISPNKKYIALNEKDEQKVAKPTISIYDLENKTHVKSLNIPFEEITCVEFVSVEFTCDSNYIVGITGPPDWMLYYYNWQSGKIESQTKAQNPNGQGTVERVDCNPSDPTLVVITGPGTFRLMNVSETVWRQWGWAKAENIAITTCMWLTADRVMFGTSIGAVMLVENGELRETSCCRGLEAKEIVMKKNEERSEADMTQAKEYFHDLKVNGDEAQEIRCLTVFPKGFVFSCTSGLIHMFEKQSRYTWTKRNVFRVMDGPFQVGENQFIDLNVIKHVSVNPSQTTLLVTTKKSQLYYVKLFEQHMEQEPEMPFYVMGAELHHGRINYLSMCSWKPIFMTSGEDDHSIRLWNYELEKLEFSKSYNEDINSVSLHPTGLFALIGFSDKLRYVVILIDDLLQMREFSIRNCKLSRFSNNGHVFAAVDKLVIKIYSTISFANVFNLKGHDALIQDLSWTSSDDKLFSCGSDGAIYEWCMTSGKRLNEIVQKNNDFTGCSVSGDGKSAYIVGVDGEVKEVRNNKIIRNLKIIGIKLDNIVLARSDQMLFVTGGNGIVVSIQCPLLDKAVFSEFHIHNRNVTAMSLSYDDQTLITVAEDATICIWKLDNTERKAVVMDKSYRYSQEILINKDDLDDKNYTISELSKRIEEMKSEHDYQVKQIDESHTETLSNLNTKYRDIIKELKEKIEYMEISHDDEINRMKSDKEIVINEYEKKIEDIKGEFSVKMIEEYGKYEELENVNMDLKNSYEKELMKEKSSKSDALQEVKDHYELIILEKNNIISELEEKNKKESDQHEYIKRLIEDDADREIVEIKANYEKRLKEEKDLNVTLHGENGVLKKKIVSAQKTIEDYSDEVKDLRDTLKQQQDTIKMLEHRISELKAEIKDRDRKIYEKEKRLGGLKTKIVDFENANFVFNIKIETLEQQSIQKDEELLEANKEIESLKANLKKMEMLDVTKNIEIENINQRNYALNMEIKRLNEKLYDANIINKKMQNEILELSSNIQEPAKLKSAVKKLIQEKTTSQKQISKDTDREENTEVSKKMQHLENQIHRADKKLRITTASVKKKNMKIMEENSKLLEEISELRNGLVLANKQCADMKTLLGFSAKTNSANMRSMVQKACSNYDEIVDQFDKKLREKDLMIDTLTEQLESETRSPVVEN